MSEKRYINVMSKISPADAERLDGQSPPRNPRSKIMVSVRLTPHLYQEIGRIASERYASRSLVIRSLLERSIEELAEYEESDQRRLR